MGTGARVRIGLVAIAALLALAAGCHRPASSSGTSEGQASATTTTAPAASAAPPADHLGPDELVEGSQEAFGVTLPRDIQVKGTFFDVVYASSHASVHALTKYFRARLEDGSMREGARAASFEHVRVRGKPGLELLIRVAAARDGATVEIRNATPPTVAPLPDEAARWKQVGLTPHGRLADPTHLD
jgi:hypothetical protein